MLQVSMQDVKGFVLLAKRWLASPRVGGGSVGGGFFFDHALMQHVVGCRRLRQADVCRFCKLAMRKKTCNGSNYMISSGGRRRKLRKLRKQHKEQLQRKEESTLNPQQ